MAAAPPAQLTPTGELSPPRDPSACIPPLLPTNKWRSFILQEICQTKVLSSHVLWENPTPEIHLSVTVVISSKAATQTHPKIFQFLIIREEFCLSSQETSTVGTEMWHSDPSFWEGFASGSRLHCPPPQAWPRLQRTAWLRPHLSSHPSTLLWACGGPGPSALCRTSRNSVCSNAPS